MPIRAVAIFALLIVAPLLMAVINPSKQPVNLALDYEVVLVARITTLDLNGNRLEAAVEKICQGRFAPTVLTITVDTAATHGLFTLTPGQRLVAYVGKKLRGKGNELLFYTGTWQTATMPDAASPGV